MKTYNQFMLDNELVESLRTYAAIAAADNQTINEMVNELDNEYLFEGKIDSLLHKAGLHVHKSRGLIGYLKDAGVGIAKLFVAAIRRDKKAVKDIVSSIDKGDVVDFLLRLDMATLHIVTGPIHLIDAVTGWHLWAAVKDKANKAGNAVIDKIKKAIEAVKTSLAKVIPDKKRIQSHYKALDRIEKEVAPA